MSSNDETPVKGHEYDGIKEFDNPLPMWWVMTFVGTIIFSFIYMIHYHTDTKRLIVDEYREDLEAIQSITQSKNVIKISLESLNTAILNPGAIAKGRGVFSNRCVVCHGNDGGGGIGPNLCDNTWIHGKGKPEDIANTVKDGVLDKGMPAWSTMMSNDEIIQVTAYVVSLKGTRPASPKAPQGNKVD